MRTKPILPLLLLVPAPSIGVLSAMILWPDTAFGTAVFSVCKVWLLLFPVVWHLAADRQRPSWSRPEKGGFVWGIGSGVAISLLIFVVWMIIGPQLLDFQLMRSQISAIGLNDPLRYTSGALYWILINSVLEEYVWRWFVVSKSVAAFGRRTGIVAAAGFFTLHHVIALAVFMDWLAVLLCSVGVFTGGIIWSWMYARFESIWPGYVSHAIVDLCIFGIGGYILFQA
jgi:membrane protease YdiL (CAAX protease family)